MPARWSRSPVVIALAAVSVAVLLAFAWRSGEPAVLYAGKPLESYLGDLVYPISEPRYRSATNALFTVGDAALPVIARSIGRPVPWYSAILIRWGNRLSPSVRARLFRQFEPYQTGQRRTGAAVALSLLGTNAAPIAGVVMQAFGRLAYDDQAVISQSLAPVGESLVPHLKTYLTNRNLPTRSLAAFVVHQMGPQGSGAVRELVAGIDGADPNHSRLVAHTLARFGDRGRAAMTNLLHSPRTVNRLVGLEALSHAPGVARWSTREVVGLLTDPEKEVRVSAAVVLAKTWSVPLAEWRGRLNDLPRTHPAIAAYEATLNLVADSVTPWTRALEEGLSMRDVDARLDMVDGLLNLDTAHEAVAACLGKLLGSATGATPDQLRRAALQQKRLVGLRRQTPETPPPLDKVPTPQSPASPDPPPPGRSP